MTLLQDRFEIVTGGKAWMAPDPDGTDVRVLALLCAAPPPLLPTRTARSRPPAPGGVAPGAPTFQPVDPRLTRTARPRKSAIVRGICTFRTWAGLSLWRQRTFRSFHFRFFRARCRG